MKLEGMRCLIDGHPHTVLRVDFQQGYRTRFSHVDPEYVALTRDDEFGLIGRHSLARLDFTSDAARALNGGEGWEN